MASKRKNLLRRIWEDYAEFASKLIVDFLVSLTIWILLWAFEFVTRFFPIPGWSAAFMENLHAAGAVAGICAFSILSIVDIIRIMRRR